MLLAVLVVLFPGTALASSPPSPVVTQSKTAVAVWQNTWKPILKRQHAAMQTQRFKAWIGSYRRLEALRLRLSNPRDNPELHAQLVRAYQAEDDLYLRAIPDIERTTKETKAIFEGDPARFRDAEYGVLDAMADLITLKLRTLSQSQLDQYLKRKPQRTLVFGTLIPRTEYPGLLAILLENAAFRPFTVEMKNFLTRESLLSVNPVYRLATPSDTDFINLGDESDPQNVVVCGTVIRLASGPEVLLSGRRYDSPRHYRWALIPDDSADKGDSEAFFQGDTYNLMP